MGDREREARIRERWTEAETLAEWEIGVGNQQAWPVFRFREMAEPLFDSAGKIRQMIAHAPEDIEYLLTRVERYREALEVITRFGAELSCADAFNEIQRIAHRALNEGEDDGS